MARSENTMENNNQIDLEFDKKLILGLYIPRDIYEVFINLHESWLKY